MHLKSREFYQLKSSTHFPTKETAHLLKKNFLCFFIFVASIKEQNFYDEKRLKNKNKRFSGKLILFVILNIFFFSLKKQN